MTLTAIKKTVARMAYLLPFRIHLVFLVLALVSAAVWLQKNNALPETSRTAIIDLFISVTALFALAVLIVSLLSAFIPWLFFLLNKKNQRSSLNIKTSDNEKALYSNQVVTITINNIIKPLFGYIRLRLQYDGQNISPKFSLVLQPKKKFFSSQLSGKYKWPVNHIKEYDISSGIIYFEDFFQFFSLAVQHTAKSNFITSPPQMKTRELVVQPKKTEETNTRIEEIRKVEGEFLNYKNFENNDDVRRIVWKIYAKNKELVVRIPETNDPYASHIYFYASFHDALTGDLYDDLNKVFLNYFKTITWNCYEQLSSQNVLLQFIPDQQSKAYYADDEIQRVKYFISTASWQKQNNLAQYFNRLNASLLCISSLNDAGQVAEALEKAGKGLAIVFVKLSNSVAGTRITDWLQWIFIKPEKNSMDKLKLVFNSSPLKRKLIENEKRIKHLLEKSECEVLII